MGFICRTLESRNSVDRPSDPSDPSRPNRIAPPVRPRVLDHAESGEPIPIVDSPARPPAPPARRSAPREAADELTAPCRSCGYDLRGLPSGGRCPECGTKIPKVVRRIATAVLKQELRGDLADAWRSFGVTALAVIPLGTPLPSLLPFGVSIAVALGFAPLFRLHALKRLREMPATMRAPVDARMRVLERWQCIEACCVALVGVYALAATFAFVPKVAGIAYPVLLAVWWLIALHFVAQLLRTGDALAGTLIDRSVLPPIGRAVLAARIAQVAGGIGFLANLAGSFGPAGPAAAQTAALVAMTVLGLVAFVLSGYACIVAAGHTTTVGDCIYEAEIFRTRDPDDDDERGGAPPPLPDAKPGTWEDEERVPLA